MPIVRPRARLQRATLNGRAAEAMDWEDYAMADLETLDPWPSLRKRCER